MSVSLPVFGFFFVSVIFALLFDWILHVRIQLAYSTAVDGVASTPYKLRPYFKWILALGYIVPFNLSMIIQPTEIGILLIVSGFAMLVYVLYAGWIAIKAMKR